MNLRISTLATGVASAAVLALAACASAPAPNVTEAPGYAVAPRAQYGYVQDIMVVQTESRSSGAGGAILGAVIGAVAGHQIGSGNGNTAATAAGAVGGAFVGNQIEQNRSRREDEIYRVNVRFDDGRQTSYDFQRVDALRIGDRVKYEDGQLYRL